MICDFLSDPKLFTTSLRDNDRNCKAMALALLLAGAIIAGVLTKSVGHGSSLWLATGVKGAMVIAWLVWSPTTPPPREQRHSEL